MGLLDDLANQSPADLGDTGAKFIDADTLARGGERYRLAEVDAPEVEKIVGGKYKQGTAGGQAATEATAKIANELGFTNIKPRLGPDGKPEKDHFGRTLTDLVDDTGKSFAQSQLEAGAFDVNKYTTDAGRVSSLLGEGRRNQEALAGIDSNPEWTAAEQYIRQGMLEDGHRTDNFRRTALNEADLDTANQYGQGGQYAQNNVQIRRSDRSLRNVARNPWSDSWNAGWQGLGESAFGFANLVGETAGWEGAAEWGEDGVRRQQEKMEGYAKRITDYKDVKGFGDALDYVVNNAAMSVPYMAVSASAVVTAPILGVVGAAGAASSLALASSAAIYTGQVWNEQEGDNKNAAIAVAGGVAQATLDRLGLDFIFAKGVAPKKLLSKAVNELVKKGATKEVAEATVAAASKKELAGFFKDAASIAKQQITAKKNVQNFLGRTGIAAGGESITEAGQELIGYTAANHANGFETFDFDALQNRLINAAVAGGTLGGVFSAPTTPKDIYAWKQVAFNADEANASEASNAAKYAEEAKETYGHVPSNQENAANARADATTYEGSSLKELSESYSEGQKSKSYTDRALEAAVRFPELFKGSVSAITTADLQARSPTVRKIADMFGGNIDKIFSGANYENSKAHHIAKLNNIARSKVDFYGSTIKGAQTKSKKEAASKELEGVWKSAINKDGDFDPSLVPNTEKRQFYIDTINKFNAAADANYNLQKKYNPELGHQKNYFSKYKALNKQSINKDRKGFMALLQSEYKYNPAQAKDLVERVVDTGQSLDEAFSVIQGGVTPGSQKGRTLNLSENPKFSAYMEQDIYTNMEEANKQAARFASHREFVGLDGKNIATMLQQVRKELGDTPEAGRAVAKMANQMQNYLDAESGNLGRATTDTGKKLQKIQKNFMFFTTLAGLPLATISSFVELGLTQRAVTNKDINVMKSLGKEFGATMISAVKEVGDATLYNIPGTERFAFKTPETAGNKWVKELGFDASGSAAQTVGATEFDAWRQPIIDNFFKWNGLQGWTNMTRAARAGIAADHFIDKLGIIQRSRQDPDAIKNKEVQLAEETMRNLGFDVDFMVEANIQQEGGRPLDKKQEEQYAEQMREGTFNFINEAVALPQSANRPLIYQDPRFALFTQFQGFIATFTATHIPKMWGDYTKRGSPEMKFNVFKTMATMIMLGYLSQALKDYLKYDEDDDDFKTGHNPNLDTPQYIQRGIRASGLLGTGERVLDKFFPLYSGGGGSETLGDWVFSSAASESPALSNAKRLLDAGGDFLAGEGQSGLEKVAKSTPGIGPLNFIGKDGAAIFSGNWKFKE